MEFDPFYRDSGCIRGDFASLLPCLFFGQVGLRQRDVREYPHGHSPLAGHFILGKKVGNGMSPLHGVFMPLASCRDGACRAALTEAADLLRESSWRKEDDGSQQFDSQREETRRAIRQILQDHDCREFGVEPGRSLHQLLWPRPATAFFKRFASFEYITAIRDRPGHLVELLETKPFAWKSYGEFMEWIHDPLHANDWWTPCVCELLADHIGVWSCVRTYSTEVKRSRFDISQYLCIRPDIAPSPLRVRCIMEQHGWAELRLTLGEKVLSIRLSNAFDPFPSLLSWLKLLARGEVPARVEIDEEGEVKALSVLYAGHPRQVLFVVQDALEDDVAVLGGIVDHAELVEAFRQELHRFFRDEYDAEHWEWEWHLGERETPCLREDMLSDHWLVTGHWGEADKDQRQ